MPATSRPLVLLPLGAAILGLAACPAPQGPAQPSLAARTLEIGRTGAVLSGVAGDGATVFTALTSAALTTGSTGRIELASVTTTIAALTALTALRGPASRADAPAWQIQLDGHGGQLLASNGRVFAALSGGATGAAGVGLRGEPGAVLVALDAATGATAWKLAIDATEWSGISALAAVPDGVVVGGSFSGTLRIAGSVVSSAGKADGFVARLTAAGTVAWLIRVGGPGADAVQGVAAAADRIAIAGTFTAGADLLGKPLVPFDDRAPDPGGFVAELAGTRELRWTDTFGGPEGVSVAGVAIDVHGAIAVAATARATVRVGVGELVVRGPADGLVAWWAPGGAPGAAVLLGGADFDGLRAIAGGERIVIAGFYSGSMRLGDRTLTAGGGDDAFIAALDTAGRVIEAWPVSGEGREEVTALAAVPGGFVAGVAHTAAAQIGDATLPAPSDPLSGAAIVVRPVH